MQEKNREFSFLKKNILKYLDNQRVSKYEFYTKTGISNGVLSQMNGLSEENLLKFLSYYRDISIEWLITGKGNMLKLSSREDRFWHCYKILQSNNTLINPSNILYPTMPNDDIFGEFCALNNINITYIETGKDQPFHSENGDFNDPFYNYQVGMVAEEQAEYYTTKKDCQKCQEKDKTIEAMKIVINHLTKT